MIQIDVKPEDIESAVKDAIINSSLGKFLEKAVREALNSYNFSRAVEEAIQRSLIEQAREIIKTDVEFQAKIRAVIDRKFTQENLIEAIAEKAFTRY